ncbi:hypothetical protein [Priestia koreensis]|uniref:hypothetical protein n=1 Tax=Priestia koreensis TaxID=284581 RepID=UPI00204125CA|nr:hypothetical protein [Priestia koreensis]MCM3003658.1 hypothetical protein [Priestia koreensis]
MSNSNRKTYIIHVENNQEELQQKINYLLGMPSFKNVLNELLFEQEHPHEDSKGK